MDWNLGDILDAVAANIDGERAALVQGDRIITWREFDQRSNRVARAMIAGGLNPGDRVAFVSRNHPGYLEGLSACLKARLAHVNINYRYRAEEIGYVFKDAGVRAVFFQKEFQPQMVALRSQFPDIQQWICIDSDDQPDSLSFEEMATQGNGTPLSIKRSGDDFLLLYTGGTTGMPKGVIWPGAKYRECQLESPLLKSRPNNLDEHIAMLRAITSPSRLIPVCPIMHGTGLNASLAELFWGGTVVLLPSPSFNPVELWQVAAREKVNKVLIVGDVFARPMLRALDEASEPYALDALQVISSAGLIWSHDIKRGLLRHLPQLALADNFGASEASGLGFSITTVQQSITTGSFHAGARTVLITDDDRILGPDQPGEGMIARGEPLPLGYFGDPEKTASVFRYINGARYAAPGDWARRDEQGFMQLIGRGSLVINTGGEKVFVEEVEEALKLLPDIDDALVVGLPDEKWGSVIVALVKSRSGGELDKTLAHQLSSSLAGYKLPKAIFSLDILPRSDAGKGDYQTARKIATRCMAERETLHQQG
ncbi:AMP-binding protein [Glaciimonas sp. CA11.2]|uniref:AMP-binding protein n=1 Tax=Glaciimonas sp. CA11.2 TaxID=3048601 RepID=UPI002AB5954A|nr:AMP-binding protein [Glaciimonas sp. CA11.2]MDY7547718.1 AMP-binding protein [Glaciimonas sp. CA11.2]MEB0161365.1 AMP-binding protein [Glaciimonas sp. CA11.2]